MYKHQKRSRNGRFTTGMSWKERIAIFTLLLLSMGYGYYNHSNFSVSANSTPVIESGEEPTNDSTGEIQEISLPEPTLEAPELTQKEEIIVYIVQVFGEDADDAILIANCESKLIPDRVGDTHLMNFNGDEWLGDSIGIFQVRTGGSNWNRAKANGMSVAAFRANLKNYKYNVDYAKTIFDDRGWDAWFNCMVKEL